MKIKLDVECIFIIKQKWEKKMTLQGFYKSFSSSFNSDKIYIPGTFIL